MPKRTYSFSVIGRESTARPNIEADDDEDFITNKLPELERKHHFRHVSGSVRCTISEERYVPEPLEKVAQLGFELVPLEI
jgi:oligoribonuclease (3'-5' exoribonuclease)